MTSNNKMSFYQSRSRGGQWCRWLFYFSPRWPKRVQMTADGFPKWKPKSSWQVSLIRKIEITSIVCSLLAIFGTDLLAIFNYFLPHDYLPPQVSSTLLLVLVLYFTLEMSGFALFVKGYLRSWFFLLDIVCILALLIEFISYEFMMNSWAVWTILGMESFHHLPLLRSGRGARYLTRVSRLSSMRLTKIVINRQGRRLTHKGTGIAAQFGRKGYEDNNSVYLYMKEKFFVAFRQIEKDGCVGRDGFSQVIRDLLCLDLEQEEEEVMYRVMTAFGRSQEIKYLEDQINMELSEEVSGSRWSTYQKSQLKVEHENKEKSEIDEVEKDGPNVQDDTKTRRLFPIINKRLAEDISEGEDSSTPVSRSLPTTHSLPTPTSSFTKLKRSSLVPWNIRNLVFSHRASGSTIADDPIINTDTVPVDCPTGAGEGFVSDTLDAVEANKQSPASSPPSTISSLPSSTASSLPSTLSSMRSSTASSLPSPAASLPSPAASFSSSSSNRMSSLRLLPARLSHKLPEVVSTVSLMKRRITRKSPFRQEVEDMTVEERMDVLTQNNILLQEMKDFEKTHPVLFLRLKMSTSQINVQVESLVWGMQLFRKIEDEDIKETGGRSQSEALTDKHRKGCQSSVEFEMRLDEVLTVDGKHISDALKAFSKRQLSEKKMNGMSENVRRSSSDDSSVETSKSGGSGFVGALMSRSRSITPVKSMNLPINTMRSNLTINKTIPIPSGGGSGGGFVSSLVQRSKSLKKSVLFSTTDSRSSNDAQSDSFMLEAGDVMSDLPITPTPTSVYHHQNNTSIMNANGQEEEEDSEEDEDLDFDSLRSITKRNSGGKFDPILGSTLQTSPPAHVKHRRSSLDSSLLVKQGLNKTASSRHTVSGDERVGDISLKSISPHKLSKGKSAKSFVPRRATSSRFAMFPGFPQPRNDQFSTTIPTSYLQHVDSFDNNNSTDSVESSSASSAAGEGSEIEKARAQLELKMSKSWIVNVLDKVKNQMKVKMKKETEKDMNFGTGDNFADHITRGSIRVAFFGVFITLLITPQLQSPKHIKCDDVDGGLPLFKILRTQVDQCSDIAYDDQGFITPLACQTIRENCTAVSIVVNEYTKLDPSPFLLRIKDCTLYSDARYSYTSQSDDYFNSYDTEALKNKDTIKLRPNEVSLLPCHNHPDDVWSLDGQRESAENIKHHIFNQETIAAFDIRATVFNEAVYAVALDGVILVLLFAMSMLLGNDTAALTEVIVTPLTRLARDMERVSRFDMTDQPRKSSSSASASRAYTSKHAQQLVKSVSRSLDENEKNNSLVSTNSVSASGKELKGKNNSKNQGMLINNDSSIDEVRSIQQSFGTMKATIQSFAKYVPRDVVNQLVRARSGTAQLNVEKREVTVLFSDIENFTKICECLGVGNKLLDLMSEYFTAMANIINSTGGCLLEFIGDAVVAVWNAPNPEEMHAVLAVSAALEMHAFLESVAADWDEKGYPRVRIRCGIHTAKVLVGNIGAPDRMKYGLLGDGINTASRLEETNKRYATRTLISEETLKTVVHQLDRSSKTLTGTTVSRTSVNNAVNASGSSGGGGSSGDGKDPLSKKATLFEPFSMTKAKELFQFRAVDRVVFKGKVNATTLYEVVDFEVEHRNKNKVIKSLSSGLSTPSNDSTSSSTAEKTEVQASNKPTTTSIKNGGQNSTDARMAATVALDAEESFQSGDTSSFANSKSIESSNKTKQSCVVDGDTQMTCENVEEATEFDRVNGEGDSPEAQVAQEAGEDVGSVVSPTAAQLVKDARRALFKPNFKFANTVKQVQTVQQLKEVMLETHNSGWNCYLKKDFSKARVLFNLVDGIQRELGPRTKVTKLPFDFGDNREGDIAAMLLRDRCDYFIEHPPPRKWNGADVLTDKHF